MSRVSRVVQEKILMRIIPTKETLEAIHRLNAGKGIEVSDREWVDMWKRVYPEYKEWLEERYQMELQSQKDYMKMFGSIAKKKPLILDPLYEWKLALAKSHYHLKKEEDIEPYDLNIEGLRMNHILQAKFKNHSLKKLTNSVDLTGYWSFIVRKDPNRVPDHEKKTIICLHKPTPKALYLANFGLHDKVYKRGSITREFHDPDTKYVKIPLKDLYVPNNEDD